MSILLLGVEVKVIYGLVTIRRDPVAGPDGSRLAMGRSGRVASAGSGLMSRACALLQVWLVLKIPVTSLSLGPRIAETDPKRRNHRKARTTDAMHSDLRTFRKARQ